MSEVTSVDSQPLTAVQRKVLDYLIEFQREQQVPPTCAEVATHMGWASPNAADECLKAIARKGYIARRPGMARGIRILKAV